MFESGGPDQNPRTVLPTDDGGRDSRSLLLRNTASPSDVSDISATLLIDQNCGQETMLYVELRNLPFNFPTFLLSQWVQTCIGTKQAIVSSPPKPRIKGKAVPSA